MLDQLVAGMDTRRKKRESMGGDPSTQPGGFAHDTLLPPFSRKIDETANGAVRPDHLVDGQLAEPVLGRNDIAVIRQEWP